MRLKIVIGRERQEVSAHAFIVTGLDERGHKMFVSLSAPPTEPLCYVATSVPALSIWRSKGEVTGWRCRREGRRTRRREVPLRKSTVKRYPGKLRRASTDGKARGRAQPNQMTE